jgi:hypothetical protein
VNSTTPSELSQLHVLTILVIAVRTFYFEATSTVKNYVAGKTEIETVDLAMGFVQTDAIFNLDLWDGGIGETIKQYLIAEGVAIVNKPIDIPVDHWKQ